MGCTVYDRPQAMPNLAVLGQQPQVGTALAEDGRHLPWLRRRAALHDRRDHRKEGDDSHLMPATGQRADLLALYERRRRNRRRESSLRRQRTLLPIHRVRPHALPVGSRSRTALFRRTRSRRRPRRMPLSDRRSLHRQRTPAARLPNLLLRSSLRRPDDRDFRNQPFAA